MINLCNILLPNDRVQAIPADIGKIFNPTPVTESYRSCCCCNDNNTVY